MRKTTVIETTVCDITGEDMADSGWAIVRRRDGAEVAHFHTLDHLRKNGARLSEAAQQTMWLDSENIAKFEPLHIELED